MTELAKAGKAIIMVSSEMPELISMSDRVLVVRDGAIPANYRAVRSTNRTSSSKP